MNRNPKFTGWDIEVVQENGTTERYAFTDVHRQLQRRDARLRRVVSQFMAHELLKPIDERLPPSNESASRFLREIGMLPELAA